MRKKHEGAYLPINPILWREMADGWTRKWNLLVDTPHSKEKDGAKSEVGVHIRPWYPYLKPRCGWWTRWGRDDTD